MIISYLLSTQPTKQIITILPKCFYKNYKMNLHLASSHKLRRLSALPERFLCHIYQNNN